MNIWPRSQSSKEIFEEYLTAKDMAVILALRIEVNLFYNPPFIFQTALKTLVKRPVLIELSISICDWVFNITIIDSTKQN